ncbi:MAG: heavy metal translocating P-type ATPase, partial [Anaerolineae bacterium]
ADAEILTGQSEIDQSPITGEAIPVDKKPGDPVFAGTINGQGALEARVTRPAQDSTLAKIIQMVSEAQSQRSPTQRAIDWFGSRYTVAVIAGTAAMIAIPYLWLGWDFNAAFYRGMTLLVVASPCALVISTPASVLSAIANAARHGILFKGGAHLENTGLINVVAFDKTGTLTSGEPGVTDLVPLNGLAEDDLLALAAAAEARSEHHLAKAVIRAARRRQLDVPKTADFQALMGRGAQAFVNGQEIKVGKPSMFAHTPAPPGLAQMVETLEQQGKTVMLVSRNNQLVGLIGVADSVRPPAKETVARLKGLGVTRVVMLTGDNRRAAQTIAAQAGVDEFYAELLPQNKVGILKTLAQEYGPVAMVGDGVNDAPALATATIGIAMGAAGTDVALETADVVLMADDLGKLPYAVSLGRRSRAIIKQNLAFSGLVIAVLISSAVFGLIPLPVGVVGHEGSTLLVVMNGLRLLRSRQK